MTTPQNYCTAAIGREEPDGVVTQDPPFRIPNGSYQVFNWNSCSRPGRDSRGALPISIDCSCLDQTERPLFGEQLRDALRQVGHNLPLASGQRLAAENLYLPLKTIRYQFSN
jgi:hypothetical protein